MSTRRQHETADQAPRPRSGTRQDHGPCHPRRVATTHGSATSATKLRTRGVSRRALDQDASSPQQPIYLHQRDEPLQAGEIVPVEIEIWPSGTLFRARRALRLIVQGYDLHIHPENAFAQRHGYTVNAGTHILHTGDRYDSHLLIPIIPSHE
jgi:predicted acyl esterase